MIERLSTGPIWMRNLITDWSLSETQRERLSISKGSNARRLKDSLVTPKISDGRVFTSE